MKSDYFRYILSQILKYIPLTHEMCNEAMRENPIIFFLLPDLFKTQGMWDEAVEKNLWQLINVSNRLKMQEMCNEVVRRELYTLDYVPDHRKT